MSPTEWIADRLTRTRPVDPRDELRGTLEVPPEWPPKYRYFAPVALEGESASDELIRNRC